MLTLVNLVILGKANMIYIEVLMPSLICLHHMLIVSAKEKKLKGNICSPRTSHLHKVSIHSKKSCVVCAVPVLLYYTREKTRIKEKKNE